MKFTLVLLVVVACFWCCAAQSANFYCGRRLAEVLSKLCWDHTEEKRDAGWWMSADAARSLSGVRGKRGPVDECCDKPCTVDELLAYCFY
ncbi:insulin-related peptide 4 [Spodoptera frugiperda]|uniref:Insulin-related peptide 4 n=1 Tax=Spodoptera frugiperda TaxID=7108 RepID=A0A9R0EEA9_SPOFR|nr:insulin-related peptide 4 [Spodoptera frugiperda]